MKSIKDVIKDLSSMPFSASSTYSEPNKNGDVLTAEKLQELIDKMPPPAPIYYASNLIGPDDCFKMRPDQCTFYSMAGLFDKNTKVVYVCGINVRDALIEQGVVFENFKPEEEK
jgi:hypothetical protein